MKPIQPLLVALTGMALFLSSSSPSLAIVAGGGPAKSDCYVAWQVTTPDLGANKGKIGIDCEDGNPDCDLDGTVNGRCNFAVSICVDTSLPECSLQTVSSITLSGKTQATGLQPPLLPASTATCGPNTLIQLPLKETKKGVRKPSKPLLLKLKGTTTTGKPKVDNDKLKLRCVPSQSSAQCPPNPAGGPSLLNMSVAATGTDLDNGWSGNSQNFSVVYGAVLRACLQDCAESGNPVCNENEAPTDGVNGATFGAPLPLLALGVPTCVVNRFAIPKLTGLVANLETGDITGTLHLESDVYLTVANQICPRCSGDALGRSGTCDSGARVGQSCRTDGLATVGNAPGNKNFTLSSDCRPSGSPAGTLVITMPLTTAVSSLAGPKPCEASQDDSCGGGACDAVCVGSACVATTQDGQCIDVKGGLSQLCCASKPAQPCFPTAGGGMIVRTGVAGVPAPAYPDPTYPKTANGTLVATFCEGATGSNVINGVTGLPGAGALVLPVLEEWSR